MATKKGADMEKTNRHKTRFHRVLFAKDTPFRSKVVKDKTKTLPRQYKYKHIEVQE